MDNSGFSSIRLPILGWIVLGISVEGGGITQKPQPKNWTEERYFSMIARVISSTMRANSLSAAMDSAVLRQACMMVE